MWNQDIFTSMLEASMRAAAWAILFTAACSSPSVPEDKPFVCEPPLSGTSRGCAPPLDECGPAAIPRPSGGCTPVGVDRCDPGFVLDGTGGCRVLLPAAPCGPGEVALPGELACHPLASCGSGTWGDIPLEADAIFVDASVTTSGDGSKARPFGTMTEAIAAAKARTGSPQIAIAAGTYVEQLTTAHPVRLFGRCPSLVELRAPDASGTWAFASGMPFEAHTLSVRGGDNGGIVMIGVAIDGAPEQFDARIDRVWARGGKSFGIGASSGPRVARMTIVDSLVEDAAEQGLAFVSGEATVERTVVRRVRALLADGSNAVLLSKAPKLPAGRLLLRGSIVEGAPYGVAVLAGDATIEGTLVRDIHRAEGGIGGAGVSATGASSTKVTLRGSVIERAQQAGVVAVKSAVTLERTTLRDLAPAPESGVAEGIQILQGARLVMSHSLVSGCSGVGVFVGDSEAILESSIVRTVAPRVGFSDFGAAIAAQSDQGSAVLTVKNLLVRDSLVAGIQINGATLDLIGALIEHVRPQSIDGLFGDGLAVQSAITSSGKLVVAQASLQDLVVRDVARAGVGVFGANVTLGNSLIACSAFPLALAERFDSSGSRENAVNATDAGGNACGCDTWGPCLARLQSIAPTPSFSPR